MGQTFCLRLKTLFIGLGSMPYIYPAKTVLDIKVHGSQKLEIFAYTYFETKLEDLSVIKHMEKKYLDKKHLE